MESPDKNTSYLKRYWKSVLIALLSIFLIWSLFDDMAPLYFKDERITLDSGPFNYEDLDISEDCLVDLKGVKDSSEYIKLEITYTTPEPKKFKVFTINMMGKEFQPCLSRDEFSATIYTKVGRTDSVFAFNTVVRSGKSNTKYALSIKASDPRTGKVIGSFEKSKPLPHLYTTDIITDLLKITRHDKKTPLVVASANSN